MMHAVSYQQISLSERTNQVDGLTKINKSTVNYDKFMPNLYIYPVYM